MYKYNHKWCCIAIIYELWCKLFGGKIRVIYVQEMKDINMVSFMLNTHPYKQQLRLPQNTTYPYPTPRHQKQTNKYYNHPSFVFTCPKILTLNASWIFCCLLHIICMYESLWDKYVVWKTAMVCINRIGLTKINAMGILLQAYMHHICL